MRVPVGLTVVTLTLHAEDGTVGEHQVLVARAPSAAAELSSLAFQGASMASAFDASKASGRFEARMYTSSTTLVVIASATHPSATLSIATLAVSGLSSPARITIYREYTRVSLSIVAEDGVTTANYTIDVFSEEGEPCLDPSGADGSNCEANPDEGGVGGGGGGGGEGGEETPVTSRPYVSSVWLMLILLSTALILCALSLGVCVRMHWMRVRRRTQMQEAIGSRVPVRPAGTKPRTESTLAANLAHEDTCHATVQP